FVEDWFRSYTEYETSADEILRLGENVILTINTQMARLPGSSGFVRLHDAYVFLFEDSLIVRWTAYRDIDQARAAAERLAESRGQAMSQEPTTPDVVELTRDAFDAASRTDLDAHMRFFVPDALFDVSEPGLGTFEGSAAIRSFLG